MKTLTWALEWELTGALTNWGEVEMQHKELWEN